MRRIGWCTGWPIRSSRHGRRTSGCRRGCGHMRTRRPSWAGSAASMDDRDADADAGRDSVTWMSLGAKPGDWTADPWPQLSAADVVVTHAGQNCIADVAAASRPTIVIPQTRPFDEQRTTAEVLHRHHLAVVASRWPQRHAWPVLLDRARSMDTERWKLWETEGAAGRAAKAIEDTALRCRGRSV